jgi:cytochrome c1
MRSRAIVIGLCLLAVTATGDAQTVIRQKGVPAPVVAHMELVSYQIPDEAIPVVLADTGAEAVVNNCTACHSLEYITTQPPSMGEKFWHDEVTKMIKVYGAPIEPDQAEPIAKVLSDRFGQNMAQPDGIASPAPWP